MKEYMEIQKTNTTNTGAPSTRRNSNYFEITICFLLTPIARSICKIFLVNLNFLKGKRLIIMKSYGKWVRELYTWDPNEI